MIRTLVRAPVVAVDTFDEGDEADLFSEEFQLVRRATPGRQREFSAVRSCARAALAGLGLPPVPVLPGVRNAPQWPRGVVGSMTHCAGYRAAAVAPADRVDAVGIDAEPNLPLPDGVLESIATPTELAWAGTAPAGGPVDWPRLLFSAKECVYKAWYPMTGTELDFPDATITARLTGPSRHAAASGPLGYEANSCDTNGRDATGTFTAWLRFQGRTPDGRLVATFDGRWLVRRGLVVTAITLPTMP